MAGGAGAALGLMHVYKIALLVFAVPFVVIFVVGTVNSIRAFRQSQREYVALRTRVNGLLTDTVTVSDRAFLEWATHEDQSLASSSDRRLFRRRVARAVREAIAARYHHGAKGAPSGPSPAA